MTGERKWKESLHLGWRTRTNTLRKTSMLKWSEKKGIRPMVELIKDERKPCATVNSSSKDMGKESLIKADIPTLLIETINFKRNWDGFNPMHCRASKRNCGAFG